MTYHNPLEDSRSNAAYEAESRINAASYKSGVHPQGRNDDSMTHHLTAAVALALLDVAHAIRQGADRIAEAIEGRADD
ncbi:hypothetical protein [Streptomyces canus]|uniref:hypothetical protein n=1 Tax=Streptomyces canus TaxID=58343 RepID=UPI0027846F08|nr:hypothetical protein [Streptomyces canus]MDQ1068803.1 hypothetical protein [Streptomyces canus]